MKDGKVHSEKMRKGAGMQKRSFGVQDEEGEIKNSVMKSLLRVEMSNAAGIPIMFSAILL